MAVPTSFAGQIFFRGCVVAVLFLFLLEAALGRAFLEGTPEKEKFFTESLKAVDTFAEAGWGLVGVKGRHIS